MRTHIQRISAGDDFDGTIPTTTPVYTHDIEKDWPEDSAGGFFDFSITNPSQLYSVELKLGGQAGWTLHKKDKDDVEILLWSGTTESFFVTLETDRMLLHDGDRLVLRTTGATGALKASITVEDGGF